MRQGLKLCIALGASLVSLWAQEASQGGPADEGPGLQDLQQVLDQPVATASKRLQRLKEAPADMTVLTASDLGLMGYRTLGEALEGVVGFRVNRDRAYEGLGVRGLYVLGDQNTRVLILLDGHAMNSPVEVGSSKIGEDFGIPLDFIERIEIIRGPASSLYGNNAFLGMVNVVTRMSDARSTTGSGAWKREFVASGNDRGLGSLDGLLAGHLPGTLSGVRWQVMASGMQRTGTGQDYPELAPDRLPTELDREERQSAYLRFVGSDWSAAGYALSRTQRLASAPFLSDIGSPVNHYGNRLLFADIRYEPKLGPVETLFRIYGDRNAFTSGFEYASGRSSGQLGRFQESDPDRSLGSELQARFRPVESLLLTLGSEFSSHRYTGSAGMEANPVGTRVDFDLGNTYLQADWTLREDLTCVLGLQSSHLGVQRAEARSSGPLAIMPRSSLSDITPRLAIIWLPSAVDIVKALYGRGYRNPTIFERYYDDGTSYQANPALNPERMASIQAIWVHIWRDGFQSQLSYTHSRWTNLIQSEPVSGSVDISRFMNESDLIRGHALEAECKGRWPGWELYAQAGWYDWQRADRPLDNVASLQASLRLSRTWNAWSLGGELRHVSSREAAGAKVPAFTIPRLSLRFDQSGYWLRMVLQDIGNVRARHLVGTEYAPVRSMAEDGQTLGLNLGLRF